MVVDHRGSVRGLVKRGASKKRCLSRKDLIKVSWRVSAAVIAAGSPSKVRSALPDECDTNRGLQIAEANPDVDRCDGRAEAHPYRAEKNGSGP